MTTGQIWWTPSIFLCQLRDKSHSQRSNGWPIHPVQVHAHRTIYSLSLPIIPNPSMEIHPTVNMKCVTIETNWFTSLKLCSTRSLSIPPSKSSTQSKFGLPTKGLNIVPLLLLQVPSVGSLVGQISIPPSLFLVADALTSSFLANPDIDCCVDSSQPSGSGMGGVWSNAGMTINTLVIIGSIIWIGVCSC